MESEEIGLDEFLNEMERVESVVGEASGTECTYKDGYLDRQAVFSCLDCIPSSSPDLHAGFCFACSLACHKDHNIEEIYTKRRFRCDCGTLPQLLCSLKPDVDARNDENKYSQNFKGLYCECSRPYPDSETPELDNVEMLQCSVCEDWFHTTHLHTVVPENFEEMACGSCAGAHPFLAVYAVPVVEHVDIEEVGSNTESKACPLSASLLASNSNSESTSSDTNRLNTSEHVSTKSEPTSSTVKLSESESKRVSDSESKLEHSNASTNDSNKDNSKSESESKPEHFNGSTNDDSNKDNSKSESESKPEHSNASTNDDSNKDNSMKRPISEISESSHARSCKRKRSNECKLTGWSDTSKGVKRGLFFDEHFRNTVCKCQPCLELYKSHDIPFLSDPADTLFKYEERARVKRQNEEDELSSTLENLPHQAKCEVARAIGSLHNTLDGLMSKIAREGKDAVGRAEIMEAFKAMAAETNVDPSIFDKLGK